MSLGTARSLTFVASLLLGGGVMAADVYSPMTPEVPQTETEDGWTFTFAPYFWAAGISGDVAQFGLPAVEIDSSFSDILDHLDFGAMAIGEARYGRYSVFGDVMYSKISGSAGTPRGIVASSVEVSTETFAGLMGVGYSIVDDETVRLDVVGGARVWSVDTDLSFSGGLLDGVSRSDGATWVDAMAGFRGNYSITPEIYLTGWGLIGAGAADLDWDVAAAVGYRFSDSISAVVGYRALGVDYSNDGFVFDVVEQGPILGVVVRF
ncbi:hypothetical protein [Sinorhizobium fredii]|uniref:Outer membrane protein n=1 Tax=Rhizobium fredii TaxID=380 RepID=A0A844AHL7_RHIFR|nr:hypothetical protein [Sinorhizobium fredii]GEC35522.1 hypothetical protein EFR01_56930 [Sinorhizobium fredii]GLS06732.1 hypothetical protein GCM10007864_03570 [Sinorhizobium fredii]